MIKESKYRLILVSGWILAVVLALSFLRCQIDKRRLEKLLALQTQKAESFAEEIDRSKQEKERAEQKEERIGREALDYLEWQYVLSDQVSQAAERLTREIRKVRDLKKSKELINLLYYNLGLSYTLAVDFDAAIAAFEKALKYKREDPQSCYNLGLLYSTYRQNPIKAVKYYKKYLKLLPSGPKAGEVKERLDLLQGDK